MIVCELHENNKMSKWQYNAWISTIQRNTNIYFRFLCRPDMIVFSLKIFTSKYHGNIYMDVFFINFEYEISIYDFYKNM
jgi:hypothetical protein